MKQLRDFNYERIYRHPEVEAKTAKCDHIIRLLFGEFCRMLADSDRGRDRRYVQARVKEAPGVEVFFHFIRNTSFVEGTPGWRIVADYVAGMTDLFAQRSYVQLFLPTPLV
jgi:dGTP triphosphohydrolase